MTTEARRDLGNIVNASISNAIEKQDHFKSSGGRRSKDFTVITQVGATVKLTLDEPIGKNIAMFALGTPTTLTDGSIEIEGLVDTQFEGLLEIVGDNEVGVQVSWTGMVQFTPSGDFNFIQDNNNFQQIQLEASVIDDTTYGFGVWNIAGESTAPNKENYTIATGKAWFTRTA